MVKKVKEQFYSKTLVQRPPFKLKVNQGVAVQKTQKTSLRAKESLKDIFCGTPCILKKNIFFSYMNNKIMNNKQNFASVIHLT